MTGAEAPISTSARARAGAAHLARGGCTDFDAAERGLPPLAIGLSARTSLFTLDERDVVFAEASQAVYEPNQTAAAIFSYLSSPRDVAALYKDLSDLIQGGPREIERLLVEWSAAGLIDVFLEPGCPSIPAERKISLSLGDEVATVHVYGQDLGWFDSYRYLPWCASEGPKIHVWSFKGLGIVKVADRPSRIVHQSHLASSLRFLLVDYILHRTERIAIHCACLCAGDRAILLLGAPGAGKSTLAMFASEYGMTLAGDDIALFDPRSGEIMPLALPLTLKEGSWPMRGATRWSDSDSLPFERQDGVGVMYLPLRMSEQQVPLKVGGMIYINRGAQGSASLSHWPKVDCLRHVCSEAKSTSGKAAVEDIGTLVSVISNAETMVISYADAAEAGKVLGQHFAQ